MVPRIEQCIVAVISAVWAAVLLQGCSKASPNDVHDDGLCPHDFAFQFVTQSTLSEMKLAVTFGHTRLTDSVDATGTSKISLQDLTSYVTMSIPIENTSTTGVVIYAQNVDATLLVTPTGENCTVAPLGDPWGEVNAFIQSLQDFWNDDATCKFTKDSGGKDTGGAIFAKQNVASLPPFGNITFDVSFEVDRSSMLFRSIEVKAVMRSSVERLKFLDHTEITVSLDVIKATKEGPTPEDLDYESWGVPCQPPQPKRARTMPRLFARKVQDAISDILPPGLGDPIGLALDKVFSRHLSESEQPSSQNEAWRTAVTV